MILSYRFALPKDNHVSHAWTLLFEGDKREFEADAVYRYP
jgi:hypothetical protein